MQNVFMYSKKTEELHYFRDFPNNLVEEIFAQRMQFVSADDHQLHPLVITPVHTCYYEIYHTTTPKYVNYVPSIQLLYIYLYI